MNEYEQQAADFLAATGATLSITFARLAPMPWDKDGQARDIYKVKLERGSQSYEFEFGNSLNDSGTHHLYGKPQRGIAHGEGRTFRHQWTSQPLPAWTPCTEWVRNPNFSAPSAYDILSTLRPHDFRDMDEMAAEYGITKPSEAIRVWNAIEKETQALRELFNDDELGMLAEIA